MVDIGIGHGQILGIFQFLWHGGPSLYSPDAVEGLMIAHPFSMCCPCHQRIVIVWKQARDGAAAARGKCLHREAELEITVWYLCTRYEYLSVERKRRMSSTRDEEQVSNSAHSQFLCISIMYFLTSSWNALTVLATHFRWIAHLNFFGFFVVFVSKNGRSRLRRPLITSKKFNL